MRFELYAEVTWPPEGVAAAPWEVLAAAEVQGWDGVWLGGASLAPGASPEPHGIEASLHLQAAQLAATTSRVRIGVAATLGPDFHPLHLAEEIALLDVLSDGRLDWAIGAPAVGGGDARFDEQLEIALRALTGERFSHEGRYFRIPELACLPKPVQRPQPPLSIIARSPTALAAAGRSGRPLWIGPFEVLDDVARDLDAHREAARRAGRDAPAPTLVRFVHVSENARGARGTAPAFAASQRRRGGLEACAIVGDEATCTRRIAELQALLGPARFVAWTDAEALDPEAVQRSRERIVQGIAPAFRDDSGR